MIQTLFMLDRYKYNQFDISSIHIYSVDLLSACCMSGSVPGAGSTSENEIDKGLCS